MLAWIAREAPQEQKATYFAIMAAFTNLSLSISSLTTNYLNQAFIVERGNYDQLGGLFITATAIGLVVPVLTVFIVNRWRGRGAQPSSPSPYRQQKKNLENGNNRSVL